MPPDPGDRGDVYVEFFRQGNFVKATAIDAASGLEASVVGPVHAASADLQGLAVAKLRRLMGETAARRSTVPAKAPAQPRKGIIV